MSLIRNQQFFSNFGINTAAAASTTTTTTSPALSVPTNASVMTSNRRRSSNSNKSSLNRSYYIQSPSNNSSINSSCDSGNSNRASFIESDLLETNIKEIEYTLLGLMDNEAAAANRNSQRLASISSVKNKLYSGESVGRRGRIASINKNRKTSNSNVSPEGLHGILSLSNTQNISCDSFNGTSQQGFVFPTSKYLCKENADPSRQNEPIFLDTPPYFSSPESKSNQYNSYRDNISSLTNNQLAAHSQVLNSSYSALSINSIDHSSPRVYQNYDSLLNSPKLSPSPTPYRKKNGEIIMVKTPCFYENSFGNNNESGYLGSHQDISKSKNFNNYNNYHSQEGLNQNFCSPQYKKSDLSFHSPNPSNNDSFKSSQNHLNSNSHSGNISSSGGNNSKKSVKMSVPSNKRQILEEEFRKEKYPCNEKLQKLSNRLNMKYEEVQRYFKKRRTEEKETNNKFSNLVKLLNNYLETEE